MLSRKKTTMSLIIGGTTLSIVGAMAIGAAAWHDPEESVGVIRISQEHAPADDKAGTSRQVNGLDHVEGVVERRGSDVDDLYVGRVELEFGPDGWVATAGPSEDYDGDGNAEALHDELDGLAGHQARFGVRLDDEGDDGDVYTINDRAYRDPAGPPPWAARTSGGAEPASEDDVRRAAAGAVGEGARVVDLEADDDGPAAWEADVLDAQGRDHDVDLDSAGNVLSVRAD